MTPTIGTWYPHAFRTGGFLIDIDRQLFTNPPFHPMTIPNRDEQHGGLEAVGLLAQNMKGTLRAGANWHLLTPGEREALDMIAHKIARILSGSDPHDPQHWEDVAGYAHAAMRARE